ncbi:hypothetical protein MOMA_01245 [Moraxella macacae 0408225]|uniref:Uncharacterized protein n=1 Tax=Moraxella macacae 0408225 TaxID=1230338 RepID=L2F7I7_9GAMM|nr:hypothetical protein [Moraxella macacae]ELA08992.1 hypothetical protein MOMA_01245 [Moraxella macacae 0408225]
MSHSNDNIKKVLRIALVGVRPADQVILKGYLRLLMRLEADLEWVSANHEAVDLFMINAEFQHADSVQRLISAKPHAAALYITHIENSDGYLTGNILTLPLKDLNPLNQWLYTNLQFLSGHTSPRTTSNQPPQNTTKPQNRTTLDDLIASRQQNTATNPQATTPKTPDNSNSNNHNNSNNHALVLAIAKILGRLHKKEDQLLSLNNAQGATLAYIHPKQQRIWLQQASLELGAWTLNVANPQALDPKNAQDLVQFFWQFGLKNAKALQALVNTTDRYHIGSWIKPDNNNQRHNALKLQCVLEARDATLSEIISVSGVDANVAKAMLIALVMSGVLQKTTYDNLSQTVSQLTNTDSKAIDNTAQAPIMPTNQTNNLQQTKAEPPTQTEQQDGMKGFLSRLRRKLGI